MNGNKKNENVTAVDRRRQGRKRAVGVAFSALAGALLTILSPGLTSSASALGVEYAYNGPGSVHFQTTPLEAGLYSTARGPAVARLQTGTLEVGSDDDFSQPDHLSAVSEDVHVTYVLQESPLGANSWKAVEFKDVWMPIEPGQKKTIDPVTFKLKKAGTQARYRLAAAIAWTNRAPGAVLSVERVSTSSQGDYECLSARMIGWPKPINCAVSAVDNQYGIAVS
jgi:hypothetical protein